MHEQKTIGILLKTTPYLQKGHIVQFLTPEGLFSLFSRGPLSPFAEGEIHYRKTRGHLLSLQEFSPLVLHEALRERFSSLCAAGKMTKALLDSQMPAKETPLLYALFSKYLQKIPSFEKPELLSASFYLKLLVHEGLLSLDSLCSTCQSPSSGLSHGESRCSLHATRGYSQEEWEALKVLAFSKSFSEIHSVALLPPDLDDLFSEIIA